jgi:hypothetical protein
MLLFFGAVLVTLWPALTLAQAAKLESGVYENLMLAITHDGHLIGYFKEEQGEGVKKRCAFFLAGEVRDGDAELTTWSGPALRGRITAQKDGVTLAIPKGREHPGCGLVLMPEVATGVALDRIAAAPWLDLRQVAVDRAYFFEDPQGNKRMRAYLVKGDVVGVLAEHGEWLKVEYSAAPRDGSR